MWTFQDAVVLVALLLLPSLRVQLQMGSHLCQEGLSPVQLAKQNVIRLHTASQLIYILLCNLPVSDAHLLAVLYGMVHQLIPTMVAQVHLLLALSKNQVVDKS